MKLDERPLCQLQHESKTIEWEFSEFSKFTTFFLFIFYRKRGRVLRKLEKGDFFGEIGAMVSEDGSNRSVEIRN